MEWVKLTTNFYLDGAVMRAGEAAEVLFSRALAYCGDHETNGFVPAEALPFLAPTRGPSRARALVREELWTVVSGGWQVVNWHKHQATKEQMDDARRANRERQARHRRRSVSNGDRNGVTNAAVTSTELEGELEAAAAAARGTTQPAPAAPAADLPAAVAILRSALEARNLTARWDRITDEDAATIAALVELHGDGPLVKAAMAAHQPDKPLVFASGWIPGWRALRAPGQRLAVVADDCGEPGHTGTVRHCNQCKSEAIGGTFAPNKSQLSKRGER